MASPPTEPTEKHPPRILPNAHPYAAKTTSSALLSRSNLSPHNASYAKHRYVPAPVPSRLMAGTRVRHRHSSSVSMVEGEMVRTPRAIPAPWPTPPAVTTSPDNQSAPRPTNRTRRAETMPSSTTDPIPEHLEQDSWPSLYAGLPPNPKQWNTDELTTYLETSLSSDGTDAHSNDTSLMDILEYVRTRSLTGRELLRLTHGDLANTPLSDAQRTQLLEHSRTLRADVLRGRIYVDSYHSHDISDHSNDVYSLSARTASIRGASISADDLCLLADDTTDEGAAAFPLSPAMTLHRSNSVSEASTQRYRDLARMRMRRRGKVKGLVETWERASSSGSEYSASEDGESDVDPGSESILETNHSPECSSDLSSDMPDASADDVRPPVAHSGDVLRQPPLLIPPPPYTSICTVHGMDEEEEPSIEELLASPSNIPLRGARAWEADFGLGETVKRIPTSTSTDTEGIRPPIIEPGTALGSGDDGQQAGGHLVRPKRMSVQGSIGSRGRSTTKQMRVVTAIFTGSPSEGVFEGVEREGHPVDNRHYAREENGTVRCEVLASSDLQNASDNAIRTLEESIVTTRVQLDALRVRLEQIEANIARQEEELRQTQHSETLHTSEIRKRRSEASVQATADGTGPPRDETLIADAKDVLDIWETVSVFDIARMMAARAVGWLFPYSRPGLRTGDDPRQSRAPTGSCHEASDRYPFLVKWGGNSALARMSCSVILVSFAIYAAVLRRTGLGRWVRRP